MVGRIFLDMAIHDIDYICWLVGERPSSVCAFGSISSDNAELYQTFDDVDCVTAILNFPNGVMAQMEDTREANIGYEQKVEVIFVFITLFYRGEEILMNIYLLFIYIHMHYKSIIALLSASKRTVML